MKVKSTKAWHKLPCAHAQWHDVKADGTPGHCSSWHGYDRSVIATFAGEVDEHGWLVPFGELRKVKAFLEYYFDHTAVIPASDPRVKDILAFNETQTPKMFQARVLPYGVSMEMSALFIWEQVNPFIHAMTNGRCYLERIDCIEHDSNSAFLEVTEQTAMNQAQRATGYLEMKEVWEHLDPVERVKSYK